MHMEEKMSKQSIIRQMKHSQLIFLKFSTKPLSQALASVPILISKAQIMTL